MQREEFLNEGNKYNLISSYTVICRVDVGTLAVGRWLSVFYVAKLEHIYCNKT